MPIRFGRLHAALACSFSLHLYLSQEYNEALVRVFAAEHINKPIWCSVFISIHVGRCLHHLLDWLITLIAHAPTSLTYFVTL